jgi:hypothetical protein
MIDTGYSVRDGLVCVTMTADDWSLLLVSLGMAAGRALRAGDNETLKEVLGLVNRLNQGNPSFKPYDLQAEGVIR